MQSHTTSQQSQHDYHGSQLLGTIRKANPNEFPAFAKTKKAQADGGQCALGRTFQLRDLMNKNCCFWGVISVMLACHLAGARICLINQTKRSVTNMYYRIER
jgi:hypothetical protein